MNIAEILNRFNITHTCISDNYTSVYMCKLGIIRETTNIVWATKHNPESLRTVIKFNKQKLTYEELENVISAIV